MDLAIGEFQEVGDTVKQFASDDATVVVGTVIDPEMTHEIRVTVVATGLGQAVGLADSPMKVVRRPTGRVSSNYTDLEKPAVQRKRAVGDGVVGGSNESLEDLLDMSRRFCAARRIDGQHGPVPCRYRRGYATRSWRSLWPVLTVAERRLASALGGAL